VLLLFTRPSVRFCMLKRHNFFFNPFHILRQKTPPPAYPIPPRGPKWNHKLRLPLCYPLVAPIALQAAADAASPSPTHVRSSVPSIAPNHSRRRPPTLLLPQPQFPMLPNRSGHQRFRQEPRPAAGSEPHLPPPRRRSFSYLRLSRSARSRKSTPLRPQESLTPPIPCP
jgi:hypothetical protein